jgi:hypothetical protein
MQRIAASVGALSKNAGMARSSRENVSALLKLVPSIGDWRLSLSEKLDRVFGDNEAVKCALAANLSYFHDDPATLWWIFFAMAQGSYLQSGGRYVQGGSHWTFRARSAPSRTPRATAAIRSLSPAGA